MSVLLTFFLEKRVLQTNPSTSFYFSDQNQGWPKTTVFVLRNSLWSHTFDMIFSMVPPMEITNKTFDVWMPQKGADEKQFKTTFWSANNIPKITMSPHTCHPSIAKIKNNTRQSGIKWKLHNENPAQSKAKQINVNYMINIHWNGCHGACVYMYVCVDAMNRNFLTAIRMGWQNEVHIQFQQIYLFVYLFSDCLLLTQTLFCFIFSKRKVLRRDRRARQRVITKLHK